MKSKSPKRIFRSTTSFYFIFLFLFLISSCEKPLPVLAHFDKQIWISDRNACLGKRQKMASSLREQKNKFLGLSEMQIIELLGRPDVNELFKRNQKFYNYFLNPSPFCNIGKVDSLQSIKLIVRFTAMGIANEAIVE